MGRPPKEINADLVEDLAGNGCTNVEIGRILGCSDDTLVRRFADKLETGRANLNMSLRRKQVELAKAGNVTMLIWLGKQYLDQRDRQELATCELGKLYSDPADKTDGNTPVDVSG